MSLRKKIADSETALNWLARRIAGYIRIVYRTSRWHRIGFEEMDALVRAGQPVIIVSWHQRLVLAPFFFPQDQIGRVCTITSSGRAGSMVGRVQKLLGLQSIEMSSHKRHVALSREVLRRIQSGVSVGIAVDGPRGPARVASTVPLIWARASRKRIFVAAFSTRNAVELGSWDRMLLPRPHTEGVLLCREWTGTVPRKASEEQMESLRQDLEDLLNEVTADADDMMGRPPYQAPPRVS